MASDSLKLFYYPTSFYSQKVLFALAEKNFTVEKQIVQLPEFENYSSWYMQINPKGQVPLLEDGNKFISESTEIIKYIDETYEGTSLTPELGQNKWQRYQKMLDSVQIEVLQFAAVFQPEIAPTCQIPRVVKEKMKTAVLSQRRKKHLQMLLSENPELGELYRAKMASCDEFQQQVTNKETVTAEINKVRSLLEELNNEIKGRPCEWMCGTDLTIVDISLAVLLQRLYLIGLSQQLWQEERLPEIQAYYERLLLRSTFRNICVHGTGFLNMVTFGDQTGLLLFALSMFVLAVAVWSAYLFVQWL